MSSGRRKKVQCVNADGLILAYRSISEAARHYKISRTILGRELREHGVVWYNKPGVLFQFVEDSSLPSDEECYLLTSLAHLPKTLEVVQPPKRKQVPPNSPNYELMMGPLLNIPDIPLRSEIRDPDREL